MMYRWFECCGVLATTRRKHKIIINVIHNIKVYISTGTNVSRDSDVIGSESLTKTAESQKGRQLALPAACQGQGQAVSAAAADQRTVGSRCGRDVI